MARKLRIGVAGFGGIGHLHAAIYQKLPHCELVAVADRDPEKLASATGDINLGLPTAQAFHRRRERVGGASSYTFRKRLYLGLHAVAAHTAARRFLPPERDPPFEVRTILGA